MKVTGTLAVALLAGVLAVPAMAQTDTQPPMNSFDYSYYTCDNGAFMITYDSDKPTSATITTSNDNKQYALKRTPVDKGVQFADGAVKFWTDGQKVRVEGTPESFLNCKLKAG